MSNFEQKQGLAAERFVLFPRGGVSFLRKGGVSFSPEETCPFYSEEACPLLTGEACPLPQRMRVLLPRGGISFAPDEACPQLPEEACPFLPRGSVSFTLEGGVSFTLEGGVFFTPEEACPLPGGVVSFPRGRRVLYPEEAELMKDGVQKAELMRSSEEMCPPPPHIPGGGGDSRWGASRRLRFSFWRICGGPGRGPAGPGGASWVGQPGRVAGLGGRADRTVKRQRDFYHNECVSRTRVTGRRGKWGSLLS